MIAMLTTPIAWCVLLILYLSWLTRKPGNLTWRALLAPPRPRFRLRFRSRRIRIKEIMLVVLIAAVDSGLTMAMCPRQLASGFIAADLGVLAIALALGSFVACTPRVYAASAIVISIFASITRMYLSTSG
jgi:hypothetical protein